MRALPFLLASVFTTLAATGCTETQYSPVPTSDGYGPAGGEGRSSGTPPAGGGSIPGSGSSGGGVASGSGGASSGTGGGGSSSGSSGGWSTGDDASPGDDGGGGRSGDDAGASADGGGAVEGAALLILCVNQINEFRNQNQEVPLSESTDLEQYAAAAAASDAHSGEAHGYFDSTGGGGVAATEDELDGARFDPGAGAQQTMEQGLLDDEQDNGNAAANLLDPQLSQVGCGFAQDLSGNWWVDIALR